MDIVLLHFRVIKSDEVILTFPRWQMPGYTYKDILYNDLSQKREIDKESFVFLLQIPQRQRDLDISYLKDLL